MKSISNRQKKVVQPRQHRLFGPEQLRIRRKKSEKTRLPGKHR